MFSKSKNRKGVNIAGDRQAVDVRPSAVVANAGFSSRGLAGVDWISGVRVLKIGGASQSY